MAHKPEELHYTLHSKNPALLRIALTHTSYATRAKVANESKVATTDNELSVVVGDSVQSAAPSGGLARSTSPVSGFQFASRKFSWVSICASLGRGSWRQQPQR